MLVFGRRKKAEHHKNSVRKCQKKFRTFCCFLCLQRTKASRLLNERQKQQHVQVCQDILEQLKTAPNLLKRVVTGDESWIFEYDPLTKQQQSLEWKSALSERPKKARVFKYKTKVMLIAFFDAMKLSMQNSCHKAKLLISTSTKTSCNVW